MNLLKRIFQYKCCFKYIDIIDRLVLVNKEKDKRIEVPIFYWRKNE